MTIMIPTWLLYVLGAIPVGIILAFAVFGAFVLFVFSRNWR